MFVYDDLRIFLETRDYLQRFDKRVTEQRFQAKLNQSLNVIQRI